MTNTDRAAEVLADWADSEGGLASIDRDYDGDLTGGAEALADATPPLLMPDLPEKEQDGRWKVSWKHLPISHTSTAGNQVTLRTSYGWWHTDPAEARSLALALLAAANYAERNQE